MRKVLPYMGAALAALALAWSSPVNAQEQFKDLDTNHWAYAAVNELQQKGVLEGYPDGYFRGKRTLTRYEFAVALKRLLDKFGGASSNPGPQGPPGAQGAQGAQGEQGAKGDIGPPGMTPEEVADMKRLANEFRNELTSLGANVRDINNRLDAVSKDVAEIKSTLDKMPKFSGQFFVGVRSDRSRFGFFDRSGAARGASSSHFGTTDVVHDFHLGVTANLAGDTKFTGDLVTSNYLSYRASNLSGASAAVASIAGGGPTLGQRFGIYQAQLDIPVKGLGADSTLTVGRYKHHVTPLTYYRPDLDIYFNVPAYDDGNFVQDGIRLNAKFGSLKTTLWAASFASATLDNGLAFNRPLIGHGPTALNPLAAKPVGIDPQTGQLPANQTAGIQFGLPVFNVGTLGFGATVLSTNSSAPVAAATPFSTVVVYNAQLGFKEWGRWTLNLEGAKAVTQTTFDRGDGQPNEDNNAFGLHLGWASGPAKVKAGYIYIDPRYGAPGSWLRIGNWYNPTNVKGPYLRLDWKLNDSLSAYFGGNFLEGARNRRAVGHFNIADNLFRANAGVNWEVNKTWSTMVGYEGVFYDFAQGAGRVKPIEQYLTIGAGVNLTSSAALKLAYQMLNLSSNGAAGFTPALAGANSNATVFTTQLAVRF